MLAAGGGPAWPPPPNHRHPIRPVMFEFLIDPAFWTALFSVTLIQVALGADNLIIITILANKLPPARQAAAVRLGLILAMVFRIILLALVSWLLSFATRVFWELDHRILGLHFEAAFTVKSAVLGGGGLVLIWKGIKELRVKAKGVGEEVRATDRFAEVVAVIVGMNLLFSVDSILTVVGMTDSFPVMVGSVVISVALMLVFAEPLARFIHANPDFEILGLFVLLLIGFVLFLEGGHVAGASVNGSEFPYIPQWIVIFILLLMFSVDLYQNLWEQKVRKVAKAPVELGRRKK
jgi:predicted tellurium resistance membrane protein TerC